MSWAKEWKTLVVIVAIFLASSYLPVGTGRFDNALLEGLHLLKWYAREHVILCLVPAFFIAGAIAVFVSQGAVMKYLGAGANKVLAYGVASVSGTILTVCSCTVLPLFAGIWKRGAGLGPATAFLYSGPAINVLAIILTARVLGLELGVARALGAILFSVVIGLLMHTIFRSGETERAERQSVAPDAAPPRPLWQTAIHLAAIIGILVFANWGRPDAAFGFWHTVYETKWIITAVFALVLAAALVFWFGVAWTRVALATLPVVAFALILPGRPMVAFVAGVATLSILISTRHGELGEWFESSWGFAKQILPLLLLGVVIAGALLGRPGHDGLIPADWVGNALGGNSLSANLFASVAGAFMYFATLTEIPILQGLIGAGMGEGPALALLLAGPALSLPNMLVIRSVMGTRKTITFVSLVIVMATISGSIYGTLF